MELLNEYSVEALENLYKDTGATLVINDGKIVDIII